MARGWKGRLRFHQLGENAGFGAGANAGVAIASEPVTVLLNPDTEVLDAGLDRIAATAAQLGGLVGPRVLNPDGTIQASASGPEVGAWPWLRAFLPGAVQPRWLLARTEPYRLGRRTRVTWLTGVCIAAPTEVLRHLGPFDPALHMYGEDIDLGLRAAAAGVASWFEPEACRIVHHGQASSQLVYGSKEGWRAAGALNWRAAVRRAYGRGREQRAWWALRANLRLRLIAKTLLGRAGERDRAAVQAVAGAREVPELPPVALAAGGAERVPPR